MCRDQRSIGLIGFMATGKSTVGKRLATILGWEFLDTDSIIERAARKTVSEIILEDGESHFRTLESEAVKEVCNRRFAVISFGGGVILNLSNTALIKENTIVVLLRASIDTMVSRISQNEARPLLFGNSNDLRERIVSLYSARENLYVEAADIVIDTDEMSAKSTSAEIARRLGI
jgi:shikimate kinase